MASKEHDFSVGSIPRNIISLALPMTAAQLFKRLIAADTTGKSLSLPIITATFFIL